MLYRELLTSELYKQRDDFQSFAGMQAEDLVDYLQILHGFQQTSSAEIEEKLSKQENSGAIPSAELDKYRIRLGKYSPHLSLAKTFWSKAK